MNTVFGANPAIVFAITMGASVVIFFTVRLLLSLLYSTTLVRWKKFKKYIEKIRARGLPLITKYGLIGLIAFVAIPVPGTGVYGATILSWLLDIKWTVSLMAILPGAVISNSIVVLSAIGITRGINLGG
ncbi:small multi-drug export protein [Chloroflexota bacterium]